MSFVFYMLAILNNTLQINTKFVRYRNVLGKNFVRPPIFVQKQLCDACMCLYYVLELFNIVRNTSCAVSNSSTLRPRSACFKVLLAINEHFSRMLRDF